MHQRMNIALPAGITGFQAVSRICIADRYRYFRGTIFSQVNESCEHSRRDTLIYAADAVRRIVGVVTSKTRLTFQYIKFARVMSQPLCSDTGDRQDRRISSAIGSSSSLSSGTV